MNNILKKYVPLAIILVLAGMVFSGVPDFAGTGSASAVRARCEKCPRPSCVCKPGTSEGTCADGCDCRKDGKCSNT